MTAAIGAEPDFIAGTADLAWQGRDLAEDLRRLDAWLARLEGAGAAAPLRHDGLAPDHPLAVRAAALNRRLADCAAGWRRQREAIDDAGSLAAAFERQAVFLLFGKFNAGKSALCNFLADRFAAHGQPVACFRVEAGQVVPTHERFREGATETTDTLQGVALGRSLVLLDTPGLHSATPENAALTRRFTDSADGVLWLTPSASPGQVQELDELARELRRAKPVLPVISRSDVLEEDEVDGVLTKVLRNKTPANRRLQEGDVQARGREKLARMGVDEHLLRTPVSVSVHAAQGPGDPAATLRAAGFDAFWAAFAAMVEPALDYKRRKSAEILLHHGQEQVVRDLSVDILPRLNEIIDRCKAERSALDDAPAALMRRVWRQVIPALPDIVDRHAAAADRPAVGREVSALLAVQFAQALQATLPGYRTTGPATEAEAEAEAYPSFDIAPGEGDGEQGADAGADALHRHERFHAALEHAIRDASQRAADRAVDRCRRTLASFESGLLALQHRIRGDQDDLVAIVQRVRRPPTETEP
ncbi:hypothetical protein GN316_07035 [Xylophilus sp. Kf1]|nr:hypothetical protein [Xylophilus sp. Kf1]